MKHKNANLIMDCIREIHGQLDRLYYSDESEKRERIEGITEQIELLTDLFTKGLSK
jgi:hypothetical protein